MNAQTYKDALAEARRAGASHAQGDAYLAQTCYVLSRAHAVNPEMLYKGAKGKGLDARDVTRLDWQGLSDLMFEGMGL